MTATEVMCVGSVAVIVMLVGLVCRPQTSRREQHAESPPQQRRDGTLLGSVKDRRHMRRRPSPRAVADWCDELARRARGGATLRDALATTPPIDVATRARTDTLRFALERGRTTVEAVADRSTLDGPHLELARRVIEVAARLGGPCAAPIDRTAALLRQRAADGEERTVQAAQARLSAHVLTSVPLLMLALLLATDADTRDVVTSGVGLVCVSVGLALNAVGWFWMRRLVSVRR